jgi:Flp pilus assembly protein TadG
MIVAGRLLGYCRARIATFVADQSGVVLPMVTIAIAALIGLTTLAIDLGRYSDLQTQLQQAADAFALAGAAELDGHPGVGGVGDAISRANAAIDALMASRNSSEGGTAVTVSSRTYLASLPANDATNPPTDVTADPTMARFVEVVVTPASVNTLFPATLFGAVNNTLTTTAAAVAGFNEVLCKTSPLFICNPYEGETPGIYDSANIGKMFVLKAGPGGTDAFAPGNYGFLSVDGNGAKVLKDALAASDSGACFAQDGVTTEPGNVASASDALNVRFDIYEGSAKQYQDADHPPAPNVRKGCLPKNGDGCIKSYEDVDTYCHKSFPDAEKDAQGNVVCKDSSRACGLPKDLGWEDESNGLGNGTYLTGLESYWRVNHNAELPPDVVTRYDAYRKEIGDTSESKGKDNIYNNNGDGEVVGPACQEKGDENRRVIYVALIDCASVGLKGGRNTGVYVKAFAKFFLIEPVGANQAIYGEFLGLVEPGSDDGVLHDIVQLYR